MKRLWKPVGVIAATATLLGIGAVGVGRLSDHPATPQASSATAALRSNPLVSAATLGQVIADLQGRVRTFPSDWRSYAGLGLAYVQQARISADPSYYPKAEGVLHRSLSLNSGSNFDAMTGMAALAAARHDFSGSLGWAERARAINPFNANVHAVLGDAFVELGRYREAFAEFQRMVDLRPDLSTYARASYARELQGDLTGAVQAMQLALSAAGTAADTAWVHNQLGELAWNRGQLAEAERAYRRALAVDPSYLPPHAGLGKAAWAQGDTSEAIREYTWLVERYPLPEYVIALGDLYHLANRPAKAAEQYALVRAEQQLFQANGVNVDLEIALFDADHDADVAAGLAAARAEWARRHSIHVADAVAWTLYASGRYREALGYADRALGLGTRNALFFFHRGMIERALGRTAAARRDLATALEINPHFSILWSSTAARELASLGGRP